MFWRERGIKQMSNQENIRRVPLMYLLASFALLVPFPGRLAYGIVFIVLINIQMLSITFFKHLVNMLHLENLLSVLTASMLICESIIFKQLLILYSPLMALVLGFDIYLSAVSSFIISHLYPVDTAGKEATLLEFKNNMCSSLLFSLFALCIFLIRDVFGYGTITFPGRSSLISFTLLPASDTAHFGVIFAFIPGAIMLVSIAVFFVWSLKFSVGVASAELPGGEKNDAAD